MREMLRVLRVRLYHHDVNIAPRDLYAKLVFTEDGGGEESIISSSSQVIKCLRVSYEAVLMFN
jgi:hypothetical protein